MKLPKNIKENDEFLIVGQEALRLGLKDGTRVWVQKIKKDGSVLFSHPGNEGKSLEAIDADCLEPLNPIREEGMKEANQMTKRDLIAMELMAAFIGSAQFDGATSEKEAKELLEDRAKAAVLGADCLLTALLVPPKK